MSYHSNSPSRFCCFIIQSNTLLGIGSDIACNNTSCEERGGEGEKGGRRKMKKEKGREGGKGGRREGDEGGERERGRERREERGKGERGRKGKSTLSIIP